LSLIPFDLFIPSVMRTRRKESILFVLNNIFADY